jgi:hypothetical protein
MIYVKVDKRTVPMAPGDRLDMPDGLVVYFTADEAVAINRLYRLRAAETQRVIKFTEERVKRECQSDAKAP